MTETAPRTPAPGSLAIVQKFINSTEMPDGVDELRTAQLASGWLRDTIGVDLTVSEKDRKRLIATREAMRDLLEAHTGENVDPAVAVRLERLLGRAPLRPVLSADGATLTVNCRGIDSFLGMLSTAIVEATLLGTWPRLKVCRSDSCRWAYFDHSKNGRSCWCSMRSCGSREKARTYRVRQRAGSATLPVR
ncbi:MAG TPA: CGNR zinc finger domain-containing protein [Candidatus Dormibacteraeota bacterium]|nr:CGNR zinc finger domain-containing protein [Candidatus Dormibacteraeota bacterium]